MTPFQKHKLAWSDCTKCPLCERRNKVVLVRGKIPAPVLFIGEAPGASEDIIGRPFVGPAGSLLDRIINQAGQFDYCMTNLVGCIPKDDTNSKIADPPKPCILKCEPRLSEVVMMCRPRLIICVGKLAAKYVMGRYKAKQIIEIVHPAAILGMDVSQQGLAYQRCVITIQDALEDL